MIVIVSFGLDIEARSGTHPASAGTCIELCRYLLLLSSLLDKDTCAIDVWLKYVVAANQKDAVAGRPVRLSSWLADQ